MCSQRIELWSHLHSRWIKITNIWVFLRLSKPTTLTQSYVILALCGKNLTTQLFRKQELYSNKFVLSSQLYFNTSKFGKNSRTFPGFLEFENISRTSSEIHGLFKNLWTLGSTRCQHPPRWEFQGVRASMGVGDVWKLKGCFFVLQKLLLVRYCLPQYPLLNLLIFSPQSGASYLMLREEKNHLFNRTSICTINAFMPSCPSEKKQQQRNKEKTHSTIMF